MEWKNEQAHWFVKKRLNLASFLGHINPVYTVKLSFEIHFNIIQRTPKSLPHVFSFLGTLNQSSIRISHAVWSVVSALLIAVFLNLCETAAR